MATKPIFKNIANLITKKSKEAQITREVQKLANELEGLYKLVYLTTKQNELISGFRTQMEAEVAGIIKKYDELRNELRDKYLEERGMTEIKYMQNEIRMIREAQKESNVKFIV